MAPSGPPHGGQCSQICYQMALTELATLRDLTASDCNVGIKVAPVVILPDERLSLLKGRSMRKFVSLSKPSNDAWSCSRSHIHGSFPLVVSNASVSYRMCSVCSAATIFRN